MIGLKTKLNFMSLSNNMVYFDLETTGVDTENDRIVQICVIKNGVEKTMYINPTIPIPAEATAVHGISDETVKNSPTFSQISKSLHEFIKDCDLCGFNSNAFDVPLLVKEFERCGIFLDVSNVQLIDVYNIFRRLNTGGLGFCYKQYTGKEIDNAHDAKSDVLATMELLKCMAEKHTELFELDLNLYSNYDNKRLDLGNKFISLNDEIILNFGKHKGQKASNHKDFIKWMIDKGQFAKDTINIAKQILNN